MVAKLYAQGRSLSDISRAMAVSKPTVSKIIKQLADSNAALSAAQGQQNGFMGQHNGVASIPNMKQQLEMQQQQQLYDDMDDEEKQMVVDEDAGDDDDQDLDDEEGLFF